MEVRGTMRVRRGRKCVSIFRHHRMPRWRCWVVTQVVALAAVLLPGLAEGAQRLSVADIAEMYARSQVTRGQTVGIGVAIIVEGRPPKFFIYGNAVLGSPSTPSALQPRHAVRNRLQHQSVHHQSPWPAGLRGDARARSTTVRLCRTTRHSEAADAADHA